ncbi:hypothetical protein [Tortoise microvirus 79]|nr:hypothetical protein [Tortoise microvirus 79]
MVLPLLVGAAAVLGGGLIAQNAQNRAERNWNRRADAARDEPQIIRNEVDLKKLRDQAEAAGFNPLTILRAGGLANYNVQTHPNLHPLPNVQHGASPLGQAVSGMGSQFLDFGFSAAMAGLSGAGGGGTGLGGGLMSTATLSGAPAVTYHPNAIKKNGGAMSPGHLGMPSSDEWVQEIPGVTNPVHEVFNWESNPYLSDIETGAEARYGDYGAIPAAILTGIGDIAWNVGRFGNWMDTVAGPQVREVFQSWRSQNTPQIWEPLPHAPLSITVGGPNQTGR